MAPPIGDKRSVRAEMRALRRALTDQAERSDRLWSYVRSLDVVSNARVVMVFDSIPGEPITAPFIAWCRSEGKTVVLPEDEPPPRPQSVDVVIVPGTAFTPAGDRLGQGGGWYDRFLPKTRPDCTTIGVGFEPQLVDHLPTEPHDVRLDVVITDAGTTLCQASVSSPS
jgi:5-formyltetrahydrofolate cyclo-ligase